MAKESFGRDGQEGEIMKELQELKAYCQSQIDAEWTATTGCNGDDYMRGMRAAFRDVIRKIDAAMKAAEKREPGE